MILNPPPHGFTICVLALLLPPSIVLAGCGSASREGTLERNKSLVRQMNDEVWNRGDLDRIYEFYSPDFVLHFLPDGSEERGVDSLREHVRTHRQAFPDWREEIRQIVAEGELVVIRYASSGTNEGRWLGNPATGREVQIEEVSIFRIEGGRIAEQWLLPDLLGLERQLAPSNGPEGSPNPEVEQVPR